MRKSLGNAKRFEVFKRDGFRCQYCGRSSGECQIQVDHILAVSKGGGNEIENLITCCRDCNAGKGAKTIEKAEAPLEKRIEQGMKKAEEMRKYEEFLASERSRISSDAQSVLEYLGKVEVIDTKSRYYFPIPQREITIQKFLRYLTLTQIKDAIDITYLKLRGRIDFRYFCGVCWKMIDDMESDTQPSTQTEAQPCT